MKTKLLYTTLLLLFIAFSKQSNAQFSSDSSQVYYVCHATGSQVNVKAFSDGNGGTYSFWIDKRDAALGSAVYGQHLDSLGNPQWTVDGKIFAHANSKDIWKMDAIKWHSGFLISWTQGGFGIGGDTTYANYFNTSGTAYWSQPTVVANVNSGTGIIYVNFDNLEIFPADSGAIVVFGLVPSGGNNYLSYNRIDTLGNLAWPLNSKSYYGGGYYYSLTSDHHNGFYVAAYTGGLGSHIYVGHINAYGNPSYANAVDVSTVAGGRTNDQPKILCDNDTSAYALWDSNSSGDVNIAKVKPNGDLQWGNGGAKSVCGVTGYKANVDGMFYNNAIYAAWSDPRPPAANFFVYMQKLDTAGVSQWTNNGIQIFTGAAYLPYPKVAAAGNNIVVAYAVNGSYRAQQVQPDSVTQWSSNGVAIATTALPFYGDFQLVSNADGSVTSVWRESLDNICAARIRNNGTLTNIPSLSDSKIGIYPNPTTDRFTIAFKNKTSENVLISIYNATGELMFEKMSEQIGDNVININTTTFPAGMYFVKASSASFNATERLSVIR